MPDATITSTASTFGTITGTFAADQSTVTGTLTGTVTGTLTGSVGVPGPQGDPGSPGVGVPAGGTAGQFLTKIDGTNYNTDWTTVNLSAYAVKANNLSDLASASTARTNLGLGSLAVVNDAPSDGSQYARKNGAWDVVSAGTDYITSVSSPLTVTSGDLSIDLSAYAPLASPVFTGDARAVTPTFGDDDTSIATTAFVQAGLLGGTANARNLEVEVRNQSGSSIAAGSIVYISGATGNKPLITLSQANNDANSAQTMGFVKTTIANNGTGYVIVRGILDNIDTSALTEGVQLYLSPTTAGTWTTTKPYAPQHLVYVGVVIRSHPTLGTILVAVQNGYELDELHNVAAQTPANLDLLAYESSTSLWKNKTFSALGLATESFVTSQGYITSSALTGYATESWVSGQGYLTSAALSGYALESWVTAGFYPLTGNPSSFLVNADLIPYATKASPALTGNVTITTNSASPALVITQDGAGDIIQFKDVTSDTTYSFIDANGKVGTIASTTANAGFNIPHATAAPTTPVNGDIWTTTSGLFMRQNGSTKQYVDFDGTQTINGSKTFSNANNTFGNSTAAGTTSIASGATISGATKAVNLGTSGVAGSTTNIAIGSTTGTSTTTLNGIITAPGINLDLGSSNASATYSFGAGSTTTGLTKSINIGTNGGAGSTTNIAIGTGSGGTSTVTIYGAALQGGGTTTTAAADTNSTAIATTAFVIGQAGSATPLVNGTAAVGTSLRYARQDHVHGTDTTRAALAGATFTGKVNTLASAIGTAGLNIPHGTAPTTPTNGDIWTTTTGVYVRVNGATQALSTATGAAWGSITGTLSSQTDLQSALDAKLATTTAASTYQTISGMSSYLTTAAAAAGYYPLTGNPSGFLTSAPVTSVAGRTGAITLSNTDISGLGTMAVETASNYLTTATAASTYQTQAGMSSYLTTATAASTYFTIASAANKADLASPALSGTPTAPTATAGTNTTQIATTAFVTAAIPANSVKAWVNFNGTGTPAIRASLNVSSITDNGVGTWTLNFTTAMTDVNFATVGSISNDASSAMGFQPTTRAVGSVRVLARATDNGVLVDVSVISVAVFR